jgi:hypothetical protein
MLFRWITSVVVYSPIMLNTWTQFAGIVTTGSEVHPEVSGQLHAPAVSPPGKELQVLIG